MSAPGYLTPLNQSGSALVIGEIVRANGANTCTRTLASTITGITGVLGPVMSGQVGVGGPANVAVSGGPVLVLLEAGLTPAAGQIVYVSASVAGRGTTVAPELSSAIGVVVDATPYARNSTVYAMIAAAAGLSVPGLDVQRTYVSAELNLAATSTSAVLFPATAGYYLRPGITFWYPTAVAGSLSTSPTFNAGSNVARTNWLASQTPSGAAAFAAFSAGVQSQSVNCTIATPAPAVDSSILLDVTVAATGVGLTLRGRFVTFGYLIPQ